MDWSALIFVALAIAWAAYLLPLALRHHDEDARSRAVDGFSHRMRVLARREPVDARTAQLVTPDGVPVDPGATRAERKAARVERKAARAERRAAAKQARQERRAEREAAAAAAYAALTPAQRRARRAAARRATKRRRNVLAVILGATLVVVALAAFSVIAWPYVAIPVGLLLTWLVLCRVMVKGERRGLAPARRPAAPQAEASTGPNATKAGKQTAIAAEAGDSSTAAPSAPVAPAAPAAAVSDEVDPMVDTSAGIAAVVDPAMWDPVPVTLPTYVSKPAAARRTVRKIDLDSTGVWTSGRTEADAQLAREADEAAKAAKSAGRDDDQRAVGS